MRCGLIEISKEPHSPAGDNDDGDGEGDSGDGDEGDEGDHGDDGDGVGDNLQARDLLGFFLAWSFWRVQENIMRPMIIPMMFTLQNEKKLTTSRTTS